MLSVVKLISRKVIFTVFISRWFRSGMFLRMSVTWINGNQCVQLCSIFHMLYSIHWSFWHMMQYCSYSVSDFFFQNISNTDKVSPSASFSESAPQHVVSSC